MATIKDSMRMSEEKNLQNEQEGNGKAFFSDEEAERFFNQEVEADEEIAEIPPHRTWVKKIIAAMLSIVLLGNMIAFMPQIYSLPAIQFIKKNRELSRNEHIQQFKQAVVTVNAKGRKGTGFNISANGLIITNHHVVEDEKFSIVSFPHGKSYTAELAVSDPSLDIAILQIRDEDKVAELPVLELASETTWELGIPVYVIGNPLFFYQIANEGVVFGATPLQGRDLPLMMIDAPIYKGNSGSPVIDEDGKVIAVVFATTKIKVNNHSRKVGLAIPIDYVMKYIGDQ